MAKSKGKYAPDALRERFAAIKAEKDTVLAESAPIREELDALRAEIDKLEAEAHPLRQQIRKVEVPLYDLDQEAAMIARALGGRVTAPAELAAPAEEAPTA